MQGNTRFGQLIEEVGDDVSMGAKHGMGVAGSQPSDEAQRTRDRLTFQEVPGDNDCQVECRGQRCNRLRTSGRRATHYLLDRWR